MNVNGKRPATTVAPADPPPAQKAKVMDQFFNTFSNEDRAPVDEKQRRRKAVGGAAAYLLLTAVMKGGAKTIQSGPKAGQSFDSVSFQAILGRPVPPEYPEGKRHEMYFDESTQELVIDLPNPTALNEAQIKAARANAMGADPPIVVSYDDIEQREVRRYKVGTEYWFSMANTTTLPDGGIPMSLLRSDCIKPKCFVGKRDGKAYVSLDVKSASVPVPIKYDPAMMIRICRDNGIISEWWHENPRLYSDAEMNLPRGKAPKKSGPTHFFPLVCMDDTAYIKQCYSITKERGCTTVFLRRFVPQSFWWKPKKASGGESFGGSSDPPNEGNLGKFNPFCKYEIVIKQWDATKGDLRQLLPETADGPKHLCSMYKPQLVVWPNALWSYVVTQKENFWTLSPHIPYMRGYMFISEDTYKTSRTEANSGRAGIVDAQKSTAGTVQLPGLFAQAVVVDMEEYLKRGGLPVSYEGACTLMGFDKDDVAKESKSLNLTGSRGTYMDSDGHDVPMPARHTKVICLNEYTGDLRKLNKRVAEYRVLTGWSPSNWKTFDPDSKYSYIPDIIKSMTSESVVAMCMAMTNHEDRRAPTRNDEAMRTFIREARQNRDDKAMQAMVEFTDACNRTSNFSPMVFAILGPRDNIEATNMARDVRMMLEGWKKGPIVVSGASKKGTTTINAAATDSLDLVPVAIRPPTDITAAPSVPPAIQPVTADVPMPDVADAPPPLEEASVPAFGMGTQADSGDEEEASSASGSDE